MRGLAGLQRTSSLGGSGATTGGGSGAVAGGGLAGEVCSPPPSKPINFAAPPAAAQLSPFAAAAAVTPVPPRRAAPAAQQPAAAGHSRRQAGSNSEDSGAERDDQENRQPCGAPAAAAGTAGATQPPAATWLFSPARPRAAARGGAPSHEDAAGLLSPGHMPTPAREAGAAAPAATPTLHHAPSFSSWMLPATRPPPAGACAVDVADVVANLTAGGLGWWAGREGGHGRVAQGMARPAALQRAHACGLVGPAACLSPCGAPATFTRLADPCHPDARARCRPRRATRLWRQQPQRRQLVRPLPPGSPAGRAGRHSLPKLT